MSEPETPSRLSGTVLRGVSLAGSGWVLGQALNLVIYLVLARLATPNDFGQLAAASILVGISGLFADSGMMAALIQRRDRVEEAANTAMIATLLAGLGLSLIALAAAPLVGTFFHSDKVGEVAAVCSVWILLRAATNVPDAMMQRRFSFLRRVVVEPLGIVVFGATSIVALSEGMGVWGLVLGNTAQRVSMVIAAWALVGWRPHPRLASMGMWREMVGFGRHVIAGEVVRSLGGQINRALIGRIVGTAGLGQYSYASRIAQKPQGLLVNAGSYVLYPAFSRIADQEARFRPAFLRSLRWTCLIAMPIGFVMVPLGEPFAVILFGDPWRLAGYAAMAMCGYVGFRSIVSVAAETFKATGHPEVLPRMHLWSNVISVGMVVALITFGLVGVAAASSISAIATGIYAVRAVNRTAGIPVGAMLDEIRPPLLAGIAMAAVLLPLEQLVIDASAHGTVVGLALLGGELLLAAGVYLAVLTALAPPMARELLMMLRQARARLARRRGREPRVPPELPTAPTPVE